MFSHVPIVLLREQRSLYATHWHASTHSVWGVMEPETGRGRPRRPPPDGHWAIGGTIARGGDHSATRQYVPARPRLITVAKLRESRTREVVSAVRGRAHFPNIVRHSLYPSSSRRSSGDETSPRRVHAVAAAGRHGTVVEDVTQVRSLAGRTHLGARQYSCRLLSLMPMPFVTPP